MPAFPEGTTTSGASVRRFRERLFHAALLSGAPVQPVAITYGARGRPDPVVPFVGDDGFLPHLWRLAARPVLTAQVTFLPAITLRRDRYLKVQVAELHDRVRSEVESAIGLPALEPCSAVSVTETWPEHGSKR